MEGDSNVSIHCVHQYYNKHAQHQIKLDVQKRLVLRMRISVYFSKRFSLRFESQTKIIPTKLAGKDSAVQTMRSLLCSLSVQPVITALLLIHAEQSSVLAAILAVQVRQWLRNTTIRVMILLFLNHVRHCSLRYIRSIKWEAARVFSSKACNSKYIEAVLRYQQTFSWGRLVISQSHNDKTLPFSFKAAGGFTSFLLPVSRKKHLTFITSQVREIRWHLKRKQVKQFDM